MQNLQIVTYFFEIFLGKSLLVRIIGSIDNIGKIKTHIKLNK